MPIGGLRGDTRHPVATPSPSASLRGPFVKRRRNGERPPLRVRYGVRVLVEHYTKYTATCTHVLHSTFKVLLGSLATSLHSPVMSQGGAVALSQFYIVPDGRSWPFDVSFDGDFTGMQVVQ